MTTLRAAFSVAVLAGFYVVAVAILAGMAVFGLSELRRGEVGNARLLALATVVYAASMAHAFWRARLPRRAPVGVLTSRDDAPALWALVEELAEAATTPAPDEIRLLADVNAGVSEDARLLGLLPGRRYLYVGVPLLLGLDVSQLRSVLAHELGHYSHQHTRLAAVAYRGRISVARAAEKLAEDGDPVGWLLKQYAKLYLTVSSAIARRQELEADELSVRLAGRAAAQSALREIAVVDAAWAFYRERYLAPGWSAGVVPEPAQVLLGFGELLAARHDELADVRATAPSRDQGRWDTHPSHAARIAAMEQMPEPAAAPDPRPAQALVPGLAGVVGDLAEHVVATGDRRVLAWDDLTATAVSASAQRSADSVYRAAAAVAVHERATLGTVLDLVGSGHGRELLAALGSDGLAITDGEVAEALTGPLTSLVVPALVGAGAARWQHSWAGPASLVRSDGTAVDVDDVRALGRLVAHRDRTAAARERFAELGVDVDAVGQVSTDPTAHDARVLGGIGDVEVDGVLHDVVLLDRGLLLVAEPSRRKNPKDRLTALLSSALVHDLAEQHRYVPFAHVRSAVVVKRAPAHVDLTTVHGDTVALRARWSSGTLTKDSLQTFLEIADELATRTGHPEPEPEPATV
ncbi:M48 family metallopeptidase [Cellulomonas sp. 179-A 4D5 NHS]|uniref:M48 family metallopeptidase n=1 Tax=Cellulomonas sp. 179-A 4D5 NHS TaxID=3142378 RepID=UPI0039A21162